MTDARISHQVRIGTPLSRAIIAGLALSLSACQSSNLFQSDEVFVEARQTTLERSVGTVSEDNRELKDRFNSLERLYVDLVRQVRAQDAQLADMQGRLANFKKDPKAEMELSKLQGDVSNMRTQMKKLEGRVYSVEVADNNVGRQVAAAQAAATNAANKKAPSAPETAPSGTAMNGADASAPAAAAATAATSAAAATPVAPQAAPEQTFYGVHLASYRSKDQVGAGWRNIAKAFAADLNGLNARVYVQSQDGIGTFLRLIAGPLVTEQEADALCNRIRKNASEQYCRVSEFQGEPVE